MKMQEIVLKFQNGENEGVGQTYCGKKHGLKLPTSHTKTSRGTKK
jgi:hypothetical protein